MTDHPLRPDGVASGLFGPDLRLRAHTNGLAGLLGLPAEAVAYGRPLGTLLAPLGLSTPTAPAILSCRTGDGRLLDLALQPLSDGGCAFTVIDCTTARAHAEAERQAREVAETEMCAKGRFLCSMNHELRTPLNAVIGFSETLALDAVRPGPRPDPRETEEFALHIRDAGRRLLALIDDLLDLVRIDCGCHELAADTVDAGRLVQAAMLRAEAEAKKAGIRLAANDESHGVRLRVDERRLRHLLGHLLANAIRFTPDGGGIDLNARQDAAGDVHIAVRDSGAGIAPEDLRRLLLPFHLLEPAASRRTGGTGLGLQLSRAIAEAHGGRLLLDSTQGRGTTATLVLPRTRVVDPTPSVQLAQEIP